MGGGVIFISHASVYFTSDVAYRTPGRRDGGCARGRARLKVLAPVQGLADPATRAAVGTRKGVRLAQKMEAGPCIPVGIQL
jgi:hypothetical protein